jgi:hypothetical protein
VAKKHRSIDCPFCIAESWYGEDHMTACPEAVLKRLEVKLIRYRRFIKKLSFAFPMGVRPLITEFLEREKKL